MIYTITTTLPLEHGGRTFATLRRNLLMAEHFKEPIKILTTNYNANYEDIYEDYMKNQKLTLTFNLKICMIGYQDINYSHHLHAVLVKNGATLLHP